MKKQAMESLKRNSFEPTMRIRLFTATLQQTPAKRAPESVARALLPQKCFSYKRTNKDKCGQKKATLSGGLERVLERTSLGLVGT
jgi:hypothetical protein